ncbi:MAG TPA: hypothetical protein VF510_03700 [Ktedonobacterales bacterium]
MRDMHTALPAGNSTLAMCAPDVEDGDDSVWDEETTDTPPTDVIDEELDDVEINTQLRLELGRRMTIAVLDSPAGGGAALDELLAGLAAYPEVRVLIVRPEHEQDAHALEVTLAEVEREGADSLLVWTDGEATAADKGDHACSPAERWVRLVESVAERLLLFDRCFIALIGDGVSRAGARKLGYEDGFASEAPVTELVRTLVRETLAHEACGRRGSSPPCYL